MKKKTEEQLEECYRHMEPYQKNNQIAKDTCSPCEFYCGQEHDYSECRDKQCFKNLLAMQYLEWVNAF